MDLLFCAAEAACMSNNKEFFFSVSIRIGKFQLEHICRDYYAYKRKLP